MRKLILITAFALATVSASVSAQAGDRSLILAANDTPDAAATTAPAATAAPAAAKPEAATTETARPEATKKQASKPQRTHARHYEGDEAKARRIAARYGVYW
jgi:hypothetical protein